MDDDITGDPSKFAELFPAAFAPVERVSRPDLAINQAFSPHAGTPPARPDKPLSTRTRMILSLELRGHDKSEIAAKLGLKASAVYRVVNTDRYITARDALLARMDHDFAAMKPAAFAALRGGLNSRDENTALRASEAWMKAAGFGQYGRGTGVMGVTAEDVAKQLLQVNVSVNIAEGNK